VLEVGIVFQIPTPSALPHTWTLKWVYKELWSATTTLLSLPLLRCNKKNQEGNDNNVVVAFFAALKTKKKGNNNNATITFFLALHQKIKRRQWQQRCGHLFCCVATKKEKRRQRQQHTHM
jgi:hypothetical protein